MDKLRGFRLLLGRMGWKPPSLTSAKACPRCGSIRIGFSTKLDGWLTPRRYVCNDCGYVGSVVLEVEEIEEEEAERD